MPRVRNIVFFVLFGSGHLKIITLPIVPKYIANKLALSGVSLGIEYPGKLNSNEYGIDICEVR